MRGCVNCATVCPTMARKPHWLLVIDSEPAMRRYPAWNGIWSNHAPCWHVTSATMPLRGPCPGLVAHAAPGPQVPSWHTPRLLIPDPQVPLLTQKPERRDAVCLISCTQMLQRVSYMRCPLLSHSSPRLPRPNGAYVAPGEIPTASP